MSNWKIEGAYTQRTHLRRTLRYRGDVRLTRIAVLGTVLFAAMALATYHRLQDFDLGYAGLGIPFAMAAALLVALLAFDTKGLWTARPYAKIHVDEEGLTLEGVAKKPTVLLFLDVRSVQFSRIPFVGGVLTLEMDSGRRHRFSTGLERSDYLLEALASARPDLLGAEELQLYRRVAVLADHAASRAVQHLKERRKIVAKYFTYPILLGAIFIGALIIRRALQTRAAGAGPDLSGLSAYHCAWAMLSIIAVNAVLRATLAAASDIWLSHSVWRQLASDPLAVRRDRPSEDAHEWGIDVAHRWLAFGFIAVCLAMRWYA